MSKNILILNRGDTYSLSIRLPDFILPLTDNDAIYFGITKPRQAFEDAIIKKKFLKDQVSTTGYIELNIEYAESLRLKPGVYYYSMKIRRQDSNEVYTIVNKTKIFVNTN